MLSVGGVTTEYGVCTRAGKTRGTVRWGEGVRVGGASGPLLTPGFSQIVASTVTWFSGFWFQQLLLLGTVS